jgi:hypothetical protein
MSGRFIDQCRTRLVHANDSNGHAMLAEFQHDPIQAINTSHTPEASHMHVDHDLLQFLAEVKGAVESLSRSEEDLA